MRGFSLFAGIGYFFRGISLIRQPQLRRYVVVPLFVNILLFVAMIGFAVSELGNLITWVMPELPEWLHWLEWLVWPIFAFASALFVFFTFIIVANFIGAPFNGLLAEAVERQMTGREVPSGSFKDVLKELLPSLLAELRKIAYFIILAIPILLLFVIPVVNVIAPLLWVLFGAWMLVLEYCDYPMANHQLTFAQQRQQLGRKRMLVMGFGGVTLFAAMVPVVNFIVMPAAVAGATAMYVERFREKSAAEKVCLNSPN
ncbi:MAG: sulfate transporter CysZ [Gammaproteobacteria bacterium]|nr:sulfate transporter CysZ [Gammaproteobacteria bacterium]